ncbi:CLUMA_CG006205, isoform A [Clunio marinus]|uniref:CLUMA_CG006205, isoform A n=1 Tax=Clunio marinus TaxID=568069 RepID=A0A1J1I2Q0_9DIPT|nr:CLUMA_CG006205, isoform A [Clunio marinus]
MKLVKGLFDIKSFNGIPVEKCEEAMKCPEGQVYRLGPTWDCDDRICRGYLPYCENPEERVARCFCEDPLESMDGNRCVRICPPYP